MGCHPKVHKKNNDVREIIADSNSDTYDIVNWLIQD